jgi:hypothetical protein
LNSERAFHFGTNRQVAADARVGEQVMMTNCGLEATGPTAGFGPVYPAEVAQHGAAAT